MVCLPFPGKWVVKMAWFDPRFIVGRSPKIDQESRAPMNSAAPRPLFLSWGFESHSSTQKITIDTHEAPFLTIIEVMNHRFTMNSTPFHPRKISVQSSPGCRTNASLRKPSWSNARGATATSASWSSRARCPCWRSPTASNTRDVPWIWMGHAGWF